MRHAAVYDVSQFLGVGIGLGFRSPSASTSTTGSAASLLASCFGLSSLLFSSSLSFANLLSTSSMECLVFHLGLDHLCSEVLVDPVSGLSEGHMRLSLSSPHLSAHSSPSCSISFHLFTTFLALLGSALGVPPAFSHEEVSSEVSEVSFHCLSALSTKFVLSALSIVDSIHLILSLPAGFSHSLAMVFDIVFVSPSNVLKSLSIVSVSVLNSGLLSLSDLADVREPLAASSFTLGSCELLLRLAWPLVVLVSLLLRLRWLLVVASLLV